MLASRLFSVTSFISLWLFFAAAGLFFLFESSFSQAQEEPQAGEPAIGGEEIRGLEEHIRDSRNALENIRGQKETLLGELEQIKVESDIFRLENERADLFIGEHNERMRAKQQEADLISFEVRNNKAVLSQLLRDVWRNQTTDTLELLLATSSISDFLGELHRIELLGEETNETIKRLGMLEKALADEKASLEEGLLKFAELRSVSLLAGASLRERTKLREELLAETRGSEIRFQRILKESRDRLRVLHGGLFTSWGPDVTLTFDELLSEARLASSRTGVRTALLLAILRVETNFGENLGTGYWKIDMHPRDWEAFLEITSSLGLDPETTPVSRQPDYGWGGAMGPAQFLPSTWLGYREEISVLTGHETPSPWDIEDAFTAVGLKLAHAGAATGHYDDEWRSAMVYFAGDNWNDPAYSFYGNLVLDFAELFGEEIAEDGLPEDSIVQ